MAFGLRFLLAAGLGSLAFAVSSSNGEQAVLSAETREGETADAVADAADAKAGQQWSYGSSTTDDSMAAFLLAIANDPASAEYFLRVFSFSSSLNDLVTPYILPSGIRTPSVFASAARLLTFGYVSEIDATAPTAPLVLDVNNANGGNGGGEEEFNEGDPADNAFEEMSPEIQKNHLELLEQRAVASQQKEQETEVYASIRSAIAQKIIQKDLFRQMREATGRPGGVNEAEEARTTDLLSHVLMPLIRHAFHSSPKVMADATAYKEAWQQAKALLPMTADEEKTKASLEAKRDQQEQKHVASKAQTQPKAIDTTKTNTVVQAPLPQTTGVGGTTTTTTTTATNAVGTKDQPRLAEKNLQDNSAAAGAAASSSLESVESVEDSMDADVVQSQNELHSELASLEAAMASSSLATLSSFLELDEVKTRGQQHAAASSSSSSSSSFLEVSSGADAASELIAEVERLEPVSAAVGERAVVTVMNAFFNLLENPEMNFLRDVFAFDADSFCQAHDYEKAKSKARGPQEKRNLGAARNFCSPEQQGNIARLFGLHAFRLLHSAAEGALIKDSDLQELQFKAEVDEKTLLYPPARRGSSRRSSFRRQSIGGLLRSRGVVGDDDVHDFDVVMGRVPGRERKYFDTEEDEDDLIEGPDANKLFETRNLDDLLRDDDEYDDPQLLQPAVARRSSSRKLSDADKKELMFTLTGKPFSGTLDEKKDFAFPKEVSVADGGIIAKSWSKIVDPRVFFAIQSILSRSDDPCQIAQMAGSVPGLGDSDWAGGIRVNRALKDPSVPIQVGGVPAVANPAVNSARQASGSESRDLEVALKEEPQVGGHSAKNPYLLLLQSIGLVEGGFPALTAQPQNQQGSGFAMSHGYREQLVAVNKKLKELLFGADNGPAYAPHLPAEIVPASKSILAPLKLDVMFAQLSGQVTRRRAVFHAPSQQNWEAMLNGKALTAQQSPDAAYLEKLRADISLLSRVVLLAQMGAEQAARGHVDDGAKVNPKLLRPPRVLLAAAQMAFSAGYDNVYLASAPGVRKYSEHRSVLRGKWEDRALSAKATGADYGSKSTALLSYSTIDGVFLPPPVNPATRDNRLPSDPALDAATSAMKEGRLCGAILGATTKHHRKASDRVVFGRPTSYDSNNGQIVPEPSESRRSYIFCTRAKDDEPAFAAESKALATAMCAIAHNTGLGMQLQLEEWFKTQRWARKATADRDAEDAAFEKSKVDTKKKNDEGKQNYDKLKKKSPNLAPFKPDPIPSRDFIAAAPPKPVAISLRNDARLPVLSAPQASNTFGHLEAAYEPFVLDCNFLLKDEAVATQKEREVEEPLPELPANKKQPEVAVQQAEKPKDYTGMTPAQILQAKLREKNEGLAQGKIGLDAGIKGKEGDKNKQQKKPESIPAFKPVPLDLAFVDPLVSEGRRRWIDRRFITFAAKFARRTHKEAVEEWIIGHMENWDSPQHDLDRINNKGKITEQEAVVWARHHQMTRSRPVALALGPEFGLLLKAAAEGAKTARYDSEIGTGVRGGPVLVRSEEHSNLFVAVFVCSSERIVMVSFPGLNGAGGEVSAYVGLAMGTIWGKRFTEADKAMKKVLDDFRGYTIVLSGFSFGGMLSAYFSKVYGLRAYAFAPAPLAKYTFFSKRMIWNLIKTVAFAPLIPVRLAGRLTPWITPTLPRTLFHGEGSSIEFLDRMAKIKVVRGNGLVTVVSAASDWASAGYFRSKDIARNGRGYELIVVPSMLTRHFWRAHDLANYAAIPLLKSSADEVPTAEFKTTFSTKDKLTSFNIAQKHVTSWLETYKTIESQMVHTVGFEENHPPTRAESSFYPDVALDRKKDNDHLSGWGWII